MLDFWDWVDQEINARGLSYHGIEKSQGLSNAVISRPARNRSQPTLTVCRAIAGAFDLRDVDVLRRAGLIDPVPYSTEVEEEHAIVQIVRGLSPYARQSAVAMLEGLARMDRTETERGRVPENRPGNRRGQIDQGWLAQIAALPPDAPDGQVRQIVMAHVADLADVLSLDDLQRFARAFALFGATLREEREPENHNAVV